MIVYGIKNCDSVKKVRAYLEQRQISYQFHDYRLDGIDAVLIKRFIDVLGVEAVLNQRSSSWRQLPEDRKSDLSPDQVVQLMLELPTLIKRPVIDTGKQLLIGFNPELLDKSL